MAGKRAFVNVLIIKDQNKRTLPALLLFLFLQRRVGTGMTAGALKS
ncbi:hypothetical protein OHA25_53990 [Nonomuraea sp. NBC_00507]